MSENEIPTTFQRAGVITDCFGYVSEPYVYLPSSSARIVVAGDWHGNFKWARHVIRQTASVKETLESRPGLFFEHHIDVILHVGDFGIWPGASGRHYLDELEKVCAQYDVTVVVTPGNHEDWSQILSHPLEDRGDGWGKVAWFRDHIAVLPRGHRFALFGEPGKLRTFVSLGGAPSPDLYFRKPYRDWWPEEAITGTDVDLVVAGGKADIMLCHDTPNPTVPKVAAIISHNPIGFPDNVLEYCAIGRDKLTTAFNAVQPELLFHGHYHVRDTAVVTGGVGSAGLSAGAGGDQSTVFTCRIEALDMDGKPGNAVVLDLDTLQVTSLAKEVNTSRYSNRQMPERYLGNSYSAKGQGND